MRRKKYRIALPQPVLTKLHKMAKELGCTESQLVEQLLKLEAKHHEQKQNRDRGQTDARS